MSERSLAARADTPPTGWCRLMVGRYLTPLLLVLPATAVLIALFIVPLASALILSFHEQHPVLGLRTDIFTLVNYAKIVTDDYYIAVTLRTVRISTLVTLCCLVIGYPIAYFCSTLPPRARTILILGYLAPWLVSVVVKAYGWMVLLAETGVVNRFLLALGVIHEPIQFLWSEFAIVLGLTHVYLVFAILPIYTSLVAIDPRLPQAARNLGANRFNVFRWVIFPLSLPGAIAGSLLVFTLTMAAFATPSLLGGGRVKVVSVLAYEQALNLLNWPLGAAIGFFLMLVTGVVVYWYQRVAQFVVRGGA